MEVLIASRGDLGLLEGAVASVAQAPRRQLPGWASRSAPAFSVVDESQIWKRHGQRQKDLACVINNDLVSCFSSFPQIRNTKFGQGPLRLSFLVKDFFGLVAQGLRG